MDLYCGNARQLAVRLVCISVTIMASPVYGQPVLVNRHSDHHRYPTAKAIAFCPRQFISYILLRWLS